VGSWKLQKVMGLFLDLLNPLWKKVTLMEEFTFHQESVDLPRLSLDKMGLLRTSRVRLPKEKLPAEEHGAFGPQMAASVRLAKAPYVAVRTRGRARLAATRLRCESGLPELSEFIPAENAFVVVSHLCDVASQQWWLRGQERRPVGYRRGEVSVLNLWEGPAAFSSTPFDCLQFYISRAALDELADESGAQRVETLTAPLNRVDPVVNQMGAAIVDAMQAGQPECRLFLDHALFAMHAHFARVYGGMRIDGNAARGGLAPRQMRRAEEFLMAHLNEEISLAAVARECKLSVSHFVRAFKRSMGQPPYRWLLEQRLKVAKELLKFSTMPMVEIAARCGFADQAAFIRAFKRTFEVTPGEWRRMRRC
jgi:AraC family transcriptional regulator